jgi:hypothetical protein
MQNNLLIKLGHLQLNWQNLTCSKTIIWFSFTVKTSLILFKFKIKKSDQIFLLYKSFLSSVYCVSQFMLLWSLTCTAVMLSDWNSARNIGFFFCLGIHTCMRVCVGGGAFFAFQHHIVTPAGEPCPAPPQLSPYYTTYKHLGLAETPVLSSLLHRWGQQHVQACLLFSWLPNITSVSPPVFKSLLLKHLFCALLSRWSTLRFL